VIDRTRAWPTISYGILAWFISIVITVVITLAAPGCHASKQPFAINSYVCTNALEPRRMPRQCGVIQQSGKYCPKIYDIVVLSLRSSPRIDGLISSTA
jgi:hypothetical protein